MGKCCQQTIHIKENKHIFLIKYYYRNETLSLIGFTDMLFPLIILLLTFFMVSFYKNLLKLLYNQIVVF